MRAEGRTVVHSHGNLFAPGQQMCFPLWCRDHGAPLTESRSSAWETIASP